MSYSTFSVIFDMDGVLVDSNPAHLEAFQRIGGELGVPFTLEMLQRSVGMHNNRIFPMWLGDGLTPERIKELSDKKERIYREIAAPKLQPIPGSVGLVRSLHEAGVTLAVGSSGPRANVELAVRTLKVEKYFHAWVTGDDVQHGKPAPDIFLKASERLGRAPRDCVVIEDAPQGVQAALAAGMRVVAVTTSLPAEKLSAAHHVIESLDELRPETLLRMVAGRA